MSETVESDIDMLGEDSYDSQIKLVPARKYMNAVLNSYSSNKNTDSARNDSSLGARSNLNGEVLSDSSKIRNQNFPYWNEQPEPVSTYYKDNSRNDVSQSMESNISGNSNISNNSEAKFQSFSGKKDKSLKFSAGESAFTRITDHNTSNFHPNVNNKAFSLTPGPKVFSVSDKRKDETFNSDSSTIINRINRQDDFGSQIESQNKDDAFSSPFHLFRNSNSHDLNFEHKKIMNNLNETNEDDKSQYYSNQNPNSSSPDVMSIVSQILGKQSPLLNDKYYNLELDQSQYNKSLENLIKPTNMDKDLFDDLGDSNRESVGSIPSAPMPPDLIFVGNRSVPANTNKSIPNNMSNNLLNVSSGLSQINSIPSINNIDGPTISATTKDSRADFNYFNKNNQIVPNAGNDSDNESKQYNIFQNVEDLSMKFSENLSLGNPSVEQINNYSFNRYFPNDSSVTYDSSSNNYSTNNNFNGNQFNNKSLSNKFSQSIPEFTPSGNTNGKYPQYYNRTSSDNNLQQYQSNQGGYPNPRQYERYNPSNEVNNPNIRRSNSDLYNSREDLTGNQFYGGQNQNSYNDDSMKSSFNKSLKSYPNMQSYESGNNISESNMIHGSYRPEMDLSNSYNYNNIKNNKNYYNKNINDESHPNPAYPKMDKNYEPKIYNKSDRSVPHINLSSMKYDDKNKSVLQSSIDSNGSGSLSTKIGNNNDNYVRSSKDSSFKTPNYRPELVESPRSKAAYKDFYRIFKIKEKESYEAAKGFALDVVQSMPDNAIWRVFLELADLSKRNNLIDEATVFYGEVCRIQPRASMGWLEWSKMEEENGELRKSLNILVLGLNVCKINEALLTRVIKIHERLHKVNEVRGMLSVLKYESIDKVWKSVLEGTLFEARAGNIATSRKLFKYLMNHVSWYGPIYFEAFRLEEKEDRDNVALEIIKKGLMELPRYGPLWFGLLRIAERRDIHFEKRYWYMGARPQLPNVNRDSNEAIKSISKELTWKVYFEKSQSEERAGEVAANGLYNLSNCDLRTCRDELLNESRLSLVKSLLVCPANLRWKILLVGARLELSVGAITKARKLLCRAFVEVPAKSKSCVYLECSRLEEYIGNVDIAREILSKASNEMKSEWKLFLEMVLLEARCGNFSYAIQLANTSVKLHPGTGRLWAIYIQLCHRQEFVTILKGKSNLVVNRTLFVTNDEKENNDISFEGANDVSMTKSIDILGSVNVMPKDKIIRRAITEVPKSGEVWCEKCRCHLNPLNVSQFDLRQAQRSLCFAVQFTPQYGDTFIEFIRLELIAQVLLPRIMEILRVPLIPFIQEFLGEDKESDIVNILLDYRQCRKIKEDPISVPSPPFERQIRRQKIIAIEKMEYDFGNLTQSFSDIILQNLNRRCANADPNYGSAWFHCRTQPYDIPSLILKTGLNILVHEFTATHKLYARAILHYVIRCLEESSIVATDTLFNVNKESNGSNKEEEDDNYSKSQMQQHENGSSEFDSKTNHDKQRITDLLLDMSIAKSQLGSWSVLNIEGKCESTIIPIVDLNGGQLFTLTDFVTGIIEMNRTLFDNSLSEDIKRKNLFGSDQIIS